MLSNGTYSMSQEFKPQLYKNRWAKESVANTVPSPRCHCLDPQYHDDLKWSELRIHTEEQNTKCSGWQCLNELIDDAARDGREVFSPGPEMMPEQWAQITILPPSIARLKSVKHFILYGSSLVRIPPEIGEMESLENFTPYTSYRLHWFPYEIRRCKNLKQSTISTRALYGNYKYRMPFPKLPVLSDGIIPPVCSVCKGPFHEDGPLQVWISLWVATDVIPLLVNACSQECIDNLPEAAYGYVTGPHRGGLELVQPDPTYSPPRPPIILKPNMERYFKSIKNGNSAEVKRLIKNGADVNVKIIESVTALMLASKYGHHEVAQLLVEGGADVNVQDKDGITALMLASAAGHQEVAQLLIDEGADINAQDKKGQTVLMWTSAWAVGCEWGSTNSEIVKLLIEVGADVNKRIGRSGETALTLAAFKGATQIVQLLLDAGADVNVITNGQTALIRAAICGQIKVTKILLDAGADVNLKGSEGETALMMAISNKHKEVESLLRNAGAKE